MGLFTGKKGMVFGIANDRSIAWAITQALAAEGAEMGFTHLPDSDPERPKAERKLRKLVDPLGAKVVTSCDVTDDADLDKAFAMAKEAFGELDFVVHSIAYAPMADIKGPVYACSRDGFKLSMEISCYSLISLAARAKELMPNGGSILTLTYLGGEAVIPGYNIMGLCKSALETSVKYLAHELGSESNIRVNAISAGPIKTLAASAVSDQSKMDDLYTAMSPLRRPVDRDEVGKSAMFLLSDLASGITGENVHVDCGYHVMGAPVEKAAADSGE